MQGFFTIFCITLIESSTIQTAKLDTVPRWLERARQSKSLITPRAVSCIWRKTMEKDQFRAKYVECRCGNPAMSFLKIKSKYSQWFIKFQCKNCLCSSPLKAKAQTALDAWNEHFGKKSKKEIGEWDFSDSWSQFL